MTVNAFTAAAAQALGMTQSAVSHSVRTSERRIGAVLFDRGRMGASPTPAGAGAVAHARRILRLLELMGAEARGAAAGPAGTDTVAGPLRIAAFRSAALFLLPPALERLRARRPGIEPVVRAVREMGRGTAGEVLDGRADLGIATIGTSSPVPKELVGGVLLEEEYALVHPVGHPAPRSLPLVDWAENCTSAPGTGEPRRNGSLRRRLRQRTTERCSRWCPVVSEWRSCRSSPWREYPTMSRSPLSDRTGRLGPSAMSPPLSRHDPWRCGP